MRVFTLTTSLPFIGRATSPRSIPPPPLVDGAGGAIIVHHSGTMLASILTRSFASLGDSACLLELERASISTSREQVVRPAWAKYDLAGTKWHRRGGGRRKEGGSVYRTSIDRGAVNKMVSIYGQWGSLDNVG